MVPFTRINTQLVQYVAKILIHHLKKNNEKSQLALRLSNLANPVSDFRILLRYYGLVPMLQWIIYSEANPSKNKNIQLLTRLQNVANACYYPLEVLSHSSNPLNLLLPYL
jgi:hypothetical protein